MEWQNEEEIKTLEEKHVVPTIRMGQASIVGTRREQQDRTLMFYRPGYCVAAVCDGMGGLNAGEIASETAVQILEAELTDPQTCENIPELLRRVVMKVDTVISELQNDEKKPLGAGTTMVVAVINQGILYWLSVGDSKIYFIRDGRIHSLNRAHNYQLSLDIMKRRGMISEEKYQKESKKGEALISYVGMGNLSLIDSEEEGIVLEREDQLLLCSDGVFRTLKEDEILKIVRKYGNAQAAASALTEAVERSGRSSQDNASAVLVKYI